MAGENEENPAIQLGQRTTVGAKVIFQFRDGSLPIKVDEMTEIGQEVAKTVADRFHLTIEPHGVSLLPARLTKGENPVMGYVLNGEFGGTMSAEALLTYHLQRSNQALMLDPPPALVALGPVSKLRVALDVPPLTAVLLGRTHVCSLKEATQLAMALTRRNEISKVVAVYPVGPQGVQFGITEETHRSDYWVALLRESSSRRLRLPKDYKIKASYSRKDPLLGSETVTFEVPVTPFTLGAWMAQFTPRPAVPRPRGGQAREGVPRGGQGEERTRAEKNPAMQQGNGTRARQAAAPPQPPTQVQDQSNTAPPREEEAVEPQTEAAAVAIPAEAALPQEEGQNPPPNPQLNPDLVVGTSPHTDAHVADVLAAAAAEGDDPAMSEDDNEMTTRGVKRTRDTTSTTSEEEEEENGGMEGDVSPSEEECLEAMTHMMAQRHKSASRRKSNPQKAAANERPGAPSVVRGADAGPPSASGPLLCQ